MLLTVGICDFQFGQCALGHSFSLTMDRPWYKRSRNHGLVRGKPGTDPLLDGIVDVDGELPRAWVLQRHDAPDRDGVEPPLMKGRRN